jgi:hypothetical protein
MSRCSLRQRVRCLGLEKWTGTCLGSSGGWFHAREGLYPKGWRRRKRNDSHLGFCCLVCSDVGQNLALLFVQVQVLGRLWSLVVEGSGLLCSWSESWFEWSSSLTESVGVEGLVWLLSARLSGPSLCNSCSSLCCMGVPITVITGRADQADGRGKVDVPGTVSTGRADGTGKMTEWVPGFLLAKCVWLMDARCRKVVVECGS